MNQGFQEAKPEEWILFWGSDDWTADSTALQQLAEAIPTQGKDKSIDLVIAKGSGAQPQCILLFIGMAGTLQGLDGLLNGTAVIE